MCGTCGCEDKSIVPVDVQERILSGNEKQAAHNRLHFTAGEVLAINVMGSPGAGKTAVLEATARALADLVGRELAPHAADWDRDHHFPVEVIRRAAEQGYLALYIAEEDGGLGLSRLSSSLIFEQLAAGCVATTAYLTIHNMATWMLASFADQALKDTWLPGLISGQTLASYCLTEPDAGSDAANLRTRARRDGDDYVIDGSKCFISGAGSNHTRPPCH